jgi:ankyrin repeat protein
VRAGSVDIVRSLTRAGADVDTCAQSALHIAALEGRVEVAEHLLHCGANIEATCAGFSVVRGEGDGQENFVAADAPPLILAADAGAFAVVALLLRRGADVNARDSFGCTAAFAAAQGGREAALRELLRAPGVDLELGMFVPSPSPRQTSWGWGPLAVATHRGRYDAVELLLDAGARINSHDAKGDSPLHLAARAVQVAVAQLLLARGHPAQVVNHTGEAPAALLDAKFYTGRAAERPALQALLTARPGGPPRAPRAPAPAAAPAESADGVLDRPGTSRAHLAAAAAKRRKVEAAPARPRAAAPAPPPAAAAGAAQTGSRLVRRFAAGRSPAASLAHFVKGFVGTADTAPPA